MASVSVCALHLPAGAGQRTSAPRGGHPPAAHQQLFIFSSLNARMYVCMHLRMLLQRAGVQPEQYQWEESKWFLCWRWHITWGCQMWPGRHKTQAVFQWSSTGLIKMSAKCVFKGTEVRFQTWYKHRCELIHRNYRFLHRWQTIERHIQRCAPYALCGGGMLPCLIWDHRKFIHNSWSFSGNPEQ